MGLLKWVSTISLLALSFTACLLGQIGQRHPELCGDANRIVPLPLGVDASFDRQSGGATLTLAGNNSITHVDLRGVQYEVRQVCPISKGRLIVFGCNGAYNVNIIELSSGQIVDWFLAYDTVMSPDQRWLMMRRFYSFHTPSEFFSEHYAIYDLRSTPSQEEAASSVRTEAGTVVYPVVPDGPSEPWVPEWQHHQSQSSFYWAPDSRSVVFADFSNKAFSLVLIELDNGKTSAYLHTVSAPEACGDAAKLSDFPTDLQVSGAGFRPVPYESFSVVAQFASGDAACNTQPLILKREDFRKAPVEVYPPVKRRPPVLRSTP